MAMTLGEIAVRFGLELAGDPGQQVDAVAPLGAAAPGTLSFCTGIKFRRQLAATEHVVADGDLPRHQVLAHALVDPLVMAT